MLSQETIRTWHRHSFLHNHAGRSIRERQSSIDAANKSFVAFTDRQWPGAPPNADQQLACVINLLSLLRNVLVSPGPSP
jgi:hypothetical protein